MSKPIQGQHYTVVTGDTLWTIATRAYGNPNKWSKIYCANSSTIKSKNGNLIYPGEVLFIPPEEEISEAKSAAQASRFSTRSRGTFNLVIGGREIPVESGKCMRGVDLLAYSWNASIPWTPGKDPALDKAIKRYPYTDSTLYLGSTLVATGKMYGKNPEWSKSGNTAELECFSSTADLLDSTMPPPYELGDITLKTLANQLCGGLGYSVVFKVAPGAPFDLITATKTETIGKFLQKLASQRGLLCSTDEKARVIFLKAATSDKPVYAFEEGKSSLQSIKASFDGRSRFCVYRAVGQSGDADDIVSIAKDPAVIGSRQLTFTADDVDVANIKNTAEWRRAKSLADALTIPIPVTDWYTPAGSLWEPNTIVTLKSPTLDLPNPTMMLIRTVEYEFSKSGRSATLNLCPPFTLAGGEIPAEWL